MSVIVTGGLGFIGSHVVDRLVSEDYKVIVVDNEFSGSKSNLEHLVGSELIELVNIDIRDFEAVKNVFREYDTESVIHLAAIVSLDEFIKNPQLGFEVNVLGTLNIAEGCRQYDLENVVFASSTAVYGDPIYLPIDESHPTEPKNPYGASKLAGEKLLFSYAKTYGLKVVALRYFNVYGPRMRPGPYAGVIYKFVSSALKGQPIIIYGDGKQTRDFVYVKDVAEATAKALNYNSSDVFNVGTGKSITINELAKIIKDITKTNSLIQYTKERPGDIKFSQANIEKIKKKMEWEPKYSLVEGLEETIKHIKMHEKI